METGVDGRSVAEFDQLPLDGAELSVMSKDVDAVVGISFAGTGVEIKEALGMEVSVEKSGLELDNAQLVSDKSPNWGEDFGGLETVAVETSPDVEEVEGGLGKSTPMSDDPKLGGDKSLVVAMDGEAATETLGVEMEMKFEEGVEGGVSKSAPSPDESQLVSVVSPFGDDMAVDEIPRVGTDMDIVEKVEAIQSGGGKVLSELDDSGFHGAESTADRVDENEEAMADEETGMEDAGTEVEIANEVRTTSVVSNSFQLGPETPSVARVVEDDEAVVADEDMPVADMEMEMDAVEMADADKGVAGGGKRKRGRNSRIPARAPNKKATEEDVCFICFDGGELVLCDRRGCPKVYHPSCVNRDEAFFRAKGRWNCGWHICSNCQKNAHYMCYTCTFSLCKACIKDAVILCVRGNKGFCESCIKTVMLIENNELAGNEDHVDFDKSSWEYLFKDYWIDLKAKLSLSMADLTQAKNPWKGSDVLAGKLESPEEVVDTNNDQGSGSDSYENLEASKNKRRKVKKRLKSFPKEEDSPIPTEAVDAEVASTPSNNEWASKELLEFVMHMKNGDKSVLSQFDVQALLLEYIKRNKLRDPRRKSQIICDARLENLFGKARVGHFEMLKLLESHFLLKEDSQTDEIEGTVVDTDVNQLEADGNMDAPIKSSKERKRKSRKKGFERGPQSNLDDYAAINTHNINLIYLRRKLVEDLLEDTEKFHDNVVGTFVRIRISGSNQKQDVYRLVQVVGTRRADVPYKVGKKTTDLVLEILNLSKTEVVSMDTISNQEFTEEECKRLRQSIKCGLISRLTVGDILDKATEIQAARVNDWLETETVRLSHLRDRASEKGRRKELRECVEKLQLLKTPEERRRRLEEIPEIHADPNMDPSHESEDDDYEVEDEKQETYIRPRVSGFSRKGMDSVSPRKGSVSTLDSWSGTRSSSGKNWELNRSISNKDFSNKGEEVALMGEIPNEHAWNQGRDRDTQASNTEKVNSAINSETVVQNSLPFIRSESLSGSASEISQASLNAGVAETASKINESEKMWHYKDPAGKVQGPFSMVQLRKWSNTGYFPADLRIWRTTEKDIDSILLTDALAGKFHKELPPVETSFTKAQTARVPHFSSTHAGKPSGGEGAERLNVDQSDNVLAQLDLSYATGKVSTSVEVPKLPADSLGSDYSRNEPVNLPSPTPKSNTPSWMVGQASESKWSSSSFPIQQAESALGGSSFPGGQMQSSASAALDAGQATHSSTQSSLNQSGSKEHNSVEPIDISAITSVFKSGQQVMSGSQNDLSSSLTSPNPAPYSEQGIHSGSTTALPSSSQTVVTCESHGMHPTVETHGWGSGSVQKQEMVAPAQAPAQSESHAWVGASSQAIEPNPSLAVPVQPSAYGHWGAIPPTAVQNHPVGNYSTPGFSAVPAPQHDPWRHPVPGNQPSIQPTAAPNVPWGMAPPIPPNNNFPLGPRPDNVNSGWVPVQGNNPNIGWGGAPPPSANVNWGAAVNPVWVAPTGNQGPMPMVQGPPPGNANNPGWAAPAQTGNQVHTIQGPPPGNGNGNPGWIAQPMGMGNPGANIQAPMQANVNSVWVTPNGNQGPGNANPGYPGPAPGNANPGWGAPPGNAGQRDRGSQGQNSDFSGGRQRNMQSSYGIGGRRICKYHLSGYCKKGSGCNLPHF